MYNGIIETSKKLDQQRQDTRQKQDSEDRSYSQTDLINQTNVEVAKHLVRFMHEYMTKIEVSNIPEDLAKTNDIKALLNSLDSLISSQTSNSGELVANLNSGIGNLITAVDGLRETTADKSEDTNQVRQVCDELRAVQTAIANANKAILKGDKTKDVISAVKTIEKAVKGLKMAPIVNVAPTPVDLSGIESAIADIPSKIVIPETIIPENDYSDLRQAVDDVKMAVQNIVFPVAEYPTTVKVTNTDGTIVGTSYGIARIDDSFDPAYYGFENNDGNWYILRNTDTSGLWEYSVLASGGIASNWAGRAGLTYVDKGDAF